MEEGQEAGYASQVLRRVSIAARMLPPIAGWVFTTHDRPGVYHLAEVAGC